MERVRVAVTGMGIVSPVGNTVQDAWDSIRNGRSGIDRITLFDPTDSPVQIAGEVKNFDISAYGVPHRTSRKLARFSRFLLAAGIQAVEDAGFPGGVLPAERTGVIAGNCLGGEDAIDAAYRRFLAPADGARLIPALTTPLTISNEAAANLAMYFGLHGPALTVSTACASGTDAIGMAADSIRAGRTDVCLSGGTESGILAYAIECYSALQALSYHYNETPQRASRPFDRDRDGFVLSEGAAVLVLERWEHAQQRGARIYAEIAGYGATCDAWHITAPRPDGSGAAAAVRAAIADAGLEAKDIGYYNAHGTSTAVNDNAESIMLGSVFAGCEKSLHVSSTKSMTGHMIGAAGAAEAIFCIQALQDGFIPPTINLEHLSVEGSSAFDYTPLTGKAVPLQAAASASLGFGGHNSCIVLKKPQDN